MEYSYCDFVCVGGYLPGSICGFPSVIIVNTATNDVIEYCEECIGFLGLYSSAGSRKAEKTNKKYDGKNRSAMACRLKQIKLKKYNDSFLLLCLHGKKCRIFYFFLF